MGYHRRVTLRCLCEDLTTDWGNSAQHRAFLALNTAVRSVESPDSQVVLALEDVPTTARADHPLVSSFYASFESDDHGILRESISGLTNPHWWKQKVARWRGAATDNLTMGDGEVWLCAGGLRAAGESRDFYASFMASVKAGGPTRYLPTESDRRLQSVEEKVARREAWLEQVRLSVLVCIHECSKSGKSQSLHVPAPSPGKISDPLLHLVFDLTRIDGDGEDLIELLLTVQPKDQTRPNLLELAASTARSVIEPVADAWRVLPGAGTDQIWSTLISSEMLGHAQASAESGELPEHLRSSMLKMGVQSHYIHKDRIVDASVEGDAVRALCGTWFVPTSVPDDLPVCPACEGVLATLPK